MSVFIRIILRVIAGFLIARGLPEDLVAVIYEPELAFALESVLGLAIWGATELAYAAAKRFGWRT